MRKSRHFLGTPFEDAKETTLTGRGLMPWEQKVADERTGKRKFHGAFTGGFEAGYKNTCGSETGFVPAQFTSSRSNRKQVAQDVTQFMDDEDAQEISLGTNLVPKEDFQSLSSDLDTRKPVQSESIGIRLFRLLSQDRNPSKKAMYGPTMPPVGYNTEIPAHKTDCSGLGFAVLKSVLTQELGAIKQSKFKQEDKVKSLFKVQNVLYDEEEQVSGPAIQPKMSKIQVIGEFPGYVKSVPQSPIRSYPGPTVPKDYNPRPFLMQFKPYKTSNPRILNPTQRQSLIGDPVVSRAPALFEKFLSPADRERISKMKSFVKSSETQVSTSQVDMSALPFSEDVRKRERLFRYICNRDGKEVGGIAPVNVTDIQMMTASQLDKEETEFEVLYDQIKANDPTHRPAPTLTKVIVSIRTIGPWKPSELLCKRFNVPEPAVLCAVPKPKDSFGQEMLPMVKTSEVREELIDDRPLLSADLSFKDLFKSIFEEDDGEAEEQEESSEIRIGEKRMRK